MSRHKSFAKIWLAYWLVKPMVPCRKFLGRAKITTPAPGLPATGPSPREGPLLARAPSRRIGQPPSPPASLRPTDPAGAPSRLGVRRAPAREARSEPGRVATLTSPSTRRTPAAVEANSMPPWLPIAHVITNVTREPKEGGSANPTGRPEKYQRLWGWAYFARHCRDGFTIGTYMC